VGHFAIEKAISDVGPFWAWGGFSCVWLFVCAPCVNLCRYVGFCVGCRVPCSPFLCFGFLGAPARSLFAVLVHFVCSWACLRAFLVRCSFFVLCFSVVPLLLVLVSRGCFSSLILSTCGHGTQVDKIKLEKYSFPQILSVVFRESWITHLTTQFLEHSQLFLRSR